MILLWFLSVGHVLLSVNGSPVSGRTTEDGRDVFEVIETKVNFANYCFKCFSEQIFYDVIYF